MSTEPDKFRDNFTGKFVEVNGKLVPGVSVVVRPEGRDCGLLLHPTGVSLRTALQKEFGTEAVCNFILNSFSYRAARNDVHWSPRFDVGVLGITTASDLKVEKRNENSNLCFTSK